MIQSRVVHYNVSSVYQVGNICLNQAVFLCWYSLPLNLVSNHGSNPVVRT